jgi:hypothetical protein
MKPPLHTEGKPLEIGMSPIKETCSYDGEDEEYATAQQHAANSNRESDLFPRGQLQRLGLNDGRRKSTGSILRRRQISRSNHRNLKLSVSAILDFSADINQDDMEWRKEKLKELKETEEVTAAVSILKVTNKYLHPLHQGEDPMEQRRRLSFLADDDVSVMSTDSAWSTWSYAFMSNLFGSGPSQRRLSTSSVMSSRTITTTTPRQKQQRTGRRFIDLTVNGGRDDGDDDLFCLPISQGKGDSDSDGDDNSVETNYSIPVIRPKKKDTSRSPARHFLDLTEGDNHETSPKKFRFSWMGSRASNASIGYNVSASSGLNGSFPDIHNEESEADEMVDDDYDYDDVVLYSTAAWEAADAAFIANVKDVASNLERTLNDHGLESPFWTAEQIVPPFKELHSKLKENMDRIKKKEEKPVEPPPAEATPETKKSKKIVRLSQRSFFEFGDRRTLMPHDDLGGYDDLGLRTLHRDDRAYLKQFLYDYRRDGTCSLPLVLAGGLEKELGGETIEAALGILANLTSPLRRCRPGERRRSEILAEMATVQEEGEDGSVLQDNSSARSSTKSAFETLEASMGHVMEDFSDRVQEELEASIRVTD